MLSLIFIASSLGGLPLPTDPQTIVAGEQADVCAWPSAVAMLTPSSTDPEASTLLCSGTLVAPTVVLTAAHCLREDRPITEIGLGETVLPTAPPIRTVPVERCEMPPEAEPPGSVNTIRADVALCHLSEPVEDVPIVPLISACELGAIEPGATTVIVGFGATQQLDGMSDGAGRKRLAWQTVDEIDTDVWNNVTMFNLSGPGACSGDSGGPAFIQLSDGSWRVFGAGSSTYSPKGVQPPVPKGNECWGGSVYSYAGSFLEWITDEAAELVTCHDNDGLWNGGCGALPAAPGGPDEQSWSSGCMGGSTIERPTQCDDDSGTTSTGGTSSGGDLGGSDTGERGSTTAPGSTSEDATSGPSEASSTSISDPSSTAEPGETAGSQDTQDDGCGCNTSSSGSGLLLSLLMLIRRRRRKG
ncbi:MAG: S1 family peptidase [Nannocystales bacterium]